MYDDKTSFLPGDLVVWITIPRGTKVGPERTITIYEPYKEQEQMSISRVLVGGYALLVSVLNDQKRFMWVSMNDGRLYAAGISDFYFGQVTMAKVNNVSSR